MNLTINEHLQEPKILDKEYARQYEAKDGIFEIDYDFDEIGFAAFENDTSIKCVKLPESLKIIDEQAFSCCYDLEKVDFPSSLEKINAYAFSSCSLKSVSFPPSMTTIGFCSFGSCKLLDVVELNEGLETIGAGAFADCSRLSHILVPNSVSEIGDDAFARCANGFKLLVSENSYAEEYAKSKNIPYGHYT